MICSNKGVYYAEQQRLPSRKGVFFWGFVTMSYIHGCNSADACIYIDTSRVGSVAISHYHPGISGYVCTAKTTYKQTQITQKDPKK